VRSAALPKDKRNHQSRRRHASERQCQACCQSPVDHAYHDYDPKKHNRPRNHDRQDKRGRHGRLLTAALRKTQGDGRARHETAEDTGKKKAVFIAEDFHQQITQKIQPLDQHHHQPDFVGIDHVQRRRPEILIGKQRQNNHADDGKLKRRFDVREFHPPR